MLVLCGSLLSSYIVRNTVPRIHYVKRCNDIKVDFPHFFLEYEGDKSVSVI